MLLGRIACEPQKNFFDLAPLKVVHNQFGPKAVLIFFAIRATIKNMEKKIGSEALRPNPALDPFKVFVGQWQTTGSHPYFPGIVLHGRTTFDWLAGGAFLIMHSEIDHPGFPDGVAIFGSDDAAKTYFQLYFDERGISRKYDMTITGKQLKWWRDEPSFSQRVTITVEDNGNKMESQGEMSREGAAWEKDLALTYIRVR